MQDEYWDSPQGTSRSGASNIWRSVRRSRCVRSLPEAGSGLRRISAARARLAGSESPIREGIAYADSRLDCCDFAVGGLLRILYIYDDSPNIAPGLIADIEACLLKFKYWWDEPGRRTIAATTPRTTRSSSTWINCWPGQLYPDRRFEVSGRTGASTSHSPCP